MESERSRECELVRCEGRGELGSAPLIILTLKKSIGFAPMKITLKKLNYVGFDDFERIIKTLLLTVIGPGVTPFTTGKDGAREAKYVGKACYPTNVEQWDGYWVFQVKHYDISKGLDKARKAVKYAIDNELKKLTVYGYFKDTKCDNYIYVTNVPFTGEHKRGLHDYIENKKKEYKVKHFDYWDGEKVLAYINATPKVRETFFPISGIQELSKEEVDRINRVYVPPIQYEELKKSLLRNRIVSIVGQPHVGKSATAIYLANEIFVEYDLNNMLMVPIIEHLTQIPKVWNSVLIFDDLFGEIIFESIGRSSKIITSLLNHNYIIITSRDYIFETARGKEEINENISSNIPTIIQEGSYTSSDLKDILRNHLNFEQAKGGLSANTVKYINSNKSIIVDQLRFPHNIQVFTDSLTDNINTKARLREIVSISKKIENVVLNWVQHKKESIQNILMVCSLGTVFSIDDIYVICNSKWGYSLIEIESTIESNSRLLFYNDNVVKFRHPSFNFTLFEYFKNNKRSLVVEVAAIALTTERIPLTSKSKFRRILQEIVGDLDKHTLLQIIQSKNVNKNLLEVIWPTLIRMDYKYTYDVIATVSSKRKKLNTKVKQSFAASKIYLKNKEIIGFLKYLIHIRNKENFRLVEQLIYYYSFAIRNKLEFFINQLDDNRTDDLKFKIILLGSMGTKDPEKALPLLKKYANHHIAMIRMRTYKSISSFDKDEQIKLIELYKQFKDKEVNKNNIQKLEKMIGNARKFQASRQVPSG